MKNFPIHKYVWELEIYDDGTIRRKLATFAGFIGSGITDKNGREIFEGDIVILDNQRGVVRFANAQFYIDRDETEDGPFTLNSLCSPFVEVVGHIAEETL